MTKILRYAVIIGAIMLIVIGFMPVQLVRGNPTPAPFPFTCIGTEFEGTQFKFKCGNVTLDVYSEYTEGRGTYVIENLANTTNTLYVDFIAWHRAVNVNAVTVNQTPVEFAPCVDGETSCDIIIPMNFTANGTEVLQIWWNFPSVDNYDGYYGFPEHIQWISYNTGYFINGGNDWGGIPIEWEEVRFNFHTDTYFTQSQNISVICGCSFSNMNETSVELPLDSNGVPYYLYHAENINDSICISIRNVPYYQTWDVGAPIVLYIATGAAIGIPLCFVRKARNHTAILSFFGGSCSIAFCMIASWDWLRIGMIMLAVYLTGAGIIVLYHFLRPRLQKRSYKSELRNRMRGI